MQLTKKEIDKALNERHSQEVQQKLAAGDVTIAGLAVSVRMLLLRWRVSVLAICISLISIPWILPT